MHEIIINEEILENVVKNKSNLKNIDFEAIFFIFKKQMIIFLFDKYKVIKILSFLPDFKQLSIGPILGMEII